MRTAATLVCCACALARGALTIAHPNIPLPQVQDQAQVKSEDLTPLPLVIWHGLGDNYKADGLRSLGDLADKVNPGTLVYYVRLDDDAGSDRTATYLGNLTEQVSQVCADLAAHPVLGSTPAINGLGLSQGGQFLRAYVERCNAPRVANLVTFGAQHNGIAEFQSCGEGDWVCRAWEGLLHSNTWSAFVQSRLVPAQYFRDPEDLQGYLENSNFLADVNNEREVKNETYKKNMMKLDRFAMYTFSEDTTVVPKQSGWFSEVNRTSDKETKLRDRALYKEDWLGLKYLDERGRLDFREAEGPHMSLSEKTLKEAFETYFAPTKGKKAQKVSEIEMEL